jgi:glycyl-tRNA synthetase beta chain
MGEVYAKLEGYPGEICKAIHEHYAPERAGGELPKSEIGAVVGCADRMDTIVGCFAVGLEPSGSSDPFALRRHALAVIRIVEKMGWDVSLEEFIQTSILILREEIALENDNVFFSVRGFFRERYKQMMLRLGYDSDLIEAVISVEFDRIHQLHPRIDQLKRFVSESTEFHELAFTFKRIINILKKQAVSFEVDPSFFREDCESDLWETYQSLKDEIQGCLERLNYYDALGMLGRLRKPVDDFFDGVEILTKKDEALKANRVGLLQHLARVFLSVADLSKFSI